MPMAGEHFACYTYAGNSLHTAMAELLTATPMQWACWFCRKQADHQVMDTTITPVCGTCGHTAVDTLKLHLVAWMRGIMSTTGFTMDKERTLNPTNFSQLAEKLLHPHGQPTGLLDLIDHPVAENRTCACEIATLPTSNTAGVTAVSSLPAAIDNEVEEMDTADKALPNLVERQSSQSLATPASWPI